MVNTKKKNVRQEKGIRHAMGYGEVRVQSEQRLEASMQVLSGGKAFRQLKQQGPKPWEKQRQHAEGSPRRPLYLLSKVNHGENKRKRDGSEGGRQITLKACEDFGFYPERRGKEVNTGGFWAEEWHDLTDVFKKSSWLQWWGVWPEWKQDHLGSYNNLGERW